MPTPTLAPWIPGGGTALEWGLLNPCPVGVGPGGTARVRWWLVWCLDCGDRYAGRPAQVGDEHNHRDDARFAARLHADEHEADFRRFVAALRTEEARQKSGWTTRVYDLVAAATREDPDGGVWWDGTGYRLVPAGARLDAKGRRVRRRVVELVLAAGFLRQDERGEVWATADGRAMLTAWRQHRADLAQPWPARHEPEALPPLPGGDEAARRKEAARQRAVELDRWRAETRAEAERVRERAEQQHQAELAAKRERAAGAQAERERAERARTGSDITLTWSAVGAGRWTVTGSGHDRRLEVALNERDFATDMYEIRENGHFVSRHPYRHQAGAAVRQLLADGVEIGERTPDPTPAVLGRPTARGLADRWHQAPPRPLPTEGITPDHSPGQRAARRPLGRTPLRTRLRGPQRALPGRARPGRTDRHRGETRGRLDAQEHRWRVGGGRRRPTRLPHPPSGRHRTVHHRSAPAAGRARAVPGGTRPRPRRAVGMPGVGARFGLSPTTVGACIDIFRMSKKMTY
ncbi:hypothetical protein ACIQBJ_29305 [Kitasatospora sp. NPDC088391]|uniref:hypothetical protein n=1 Tax=Kitasatospora sp. NPDC088391 TaxID=3364074 RepID=UPI0038089386